MMLPHSSAPRFWGICLGVTVSVTGFGLGATDPAPSRWIGAIALVVIVIVGVGQPVRLLSIPLGLVAAGLYAAAAAALGAGGVTPTLVISAFVMALAVAGSAEMFGRVCTAEDERRFEATATVESLTPTDPLAGVLKWQHAAALFDREIDRAKRLRQELSFLLVCIEDGADLDRRFGRDGEAQVLGEVGSRLLRLCRSTDVVLYRGVGQFGIVLPDTSADLADIVARRIMEGQASALPVALRVGSATLPADGPDSADLMRVAASNLSQRFPASAARPNELDQTSANTADVAQ